MVCPTRPPWYPHGKMRPRKVIWRATAGTVILLTALFAQRPFREFPGNEYGDFPLPPDHQTPGEWTFARLMYPPFTGGYYGRGSGFGPSAGARPRARPSCPPHPPPPARHFAAAMRRLTRVYARSVEQPVNIEEGDQYDWPFLYAVEVGRWDLNEVQVRGLR